MEHVSQSLRSSKLSGDGPYTKQCEHYIEQRLATERALLTTSCTSALEMALLLLNVGPGDEVIVPSFTFVSCANAVVLRGATPIFADIEPDTLSVSAATIEPLLSARTKAAMVVHYAGASRDIVSTAKLLAGHKVPLIEDSAHAFLSTSGGKALGTFGQLGAFSFHDTKNFTMGEGGALVSSDPELIERAEILREKGTNRKQFVQGMVDKYSWVDIGSSFVPSDVLAAVLWSQLDRADEISARRASIWDQYFAGLEAWSEKFNIGRTQRFEGSSHHIFYLLTETPDDRTALVRHMKSHGIQAPFHYLPLEQTPFGQKFSQTPCPVSTKVAETLIRLPMFEELTDSEVQRVISAVEQFVPGSEH
jgi:dTDP-4-amino-4,6-dideoxygalactose transaminase